MNTETTTNQKLIFHNSGAMDPIAWEMHGVSAKLIDRPVGMFGTGFCYAVAVLLRTGHQISVLTEGKLHEFGLTPIEFRGKLFNRVTCNGKELSFSTDYGLNWSPLEAYRELYSNCTDEGGIHYLGEPMEEGTSVIVEGPAILDCIAKHNEIFLGEREPIAECSTMRFFEGQGAVYYKGVHVGVLEGASFAFESLGHLDITEDRTLKNTYDVTGKVGHAVTSHLEDKELIRRFVIMKANWESKLDYDWTWSNAFKEVVMDLWEKSPTSLNPRIQSLIRSRNPGAGFRILERSEDMVVMLEAACSFLEKAGYKVAANIKIVDNDDSNNIAFVFNNDIHLTTRSFDRGLFHLITTLFEENAHIHGHDDCTREFQNYLIEELITRTRKHLKIAL